MIISISAIKGGSGKSTTAAAMAAGLRLKKKRVLLIDVDAQGNTTETVVGDGIGDDAATVFELLTGEATVEKAIRSGGAFGDIIPASPQLATMDNKLTEVGREYKLKLAIEPIMGKYDYIIIDTPPSAGVLTINALTVADGVIIPTSADNYGLRGITYLSDVIKPVRQFLNPNLKIYGILLTRHNDRRNLRREYSVGISKVAEHLNTRLFETFIRETVVIGEAQAVHQTIFEYNSGCTAAIDYTNFINEFIKTTKGE